MKIFNGSEFVDFTGQCRVWNGSEYVAPNIFAWIGSEFKKVWPLDNVEYTDAIFAGSSFPPNYSMPINVGQDGAALILVATNNANFYGTSVNVGGVDAVLRDYVQKWQVWSVKGIPAGTQNVNVNWNDPGSNFSGGFMAMTFSGVKGITPPAIAASGQINVPGEGGLPAAFFCDSSNSRVTNQNDTVRLSGVDIRANCYGYGFTSDDSLIGITAASVRGAGFRMLSAPQPLEPIAAASNGNTASNNLSITLPVDGTLFCGIVASGGNPPGAATMTIAGQTGKQLFTRGGNNIRLTVYQWDLPAGTYVINSSYSDAVAAVAYSGPLHVGTPVWTSGNNSPASPDAVVKLAVFTGTSQVNINVAGALRSTAYKGGGFSCSVTFVDGLTSTVYNSEGNLVIPLSYAE